MADERTMATFTWLNSPLHNWQLVSTVIDMAQVHEWYCKDQMESQKKTCLRLVLKLGSLNLNIKCGQLPTSAEDADTPEHLDIVEDPEGPIDWLDGKMETLDAPTESFNVKSLIDLSSSRGRKEKEKGDESVKMAEEEAEVSWGWT
ncbi:hypothetical protein K439DRAFT_1612003 [Ramaria rubella]|nr:hypothetical protein K439DRAFT_1612003 [Ramaria rubella]